MRPYFSKEFVTCRDLARIKHRSNLKIAGLLSLIQKPPTAKGMCFLSVEDETGIFNVVVKPPVYEKYRMTFLSEPLMEISGHLERNDGAINIIAHAIFPITEPGRPEVSRSISAPTRSWR